jgi:molecular chaperone GrpE
MSKKQYQTEEVLEEQEPVEVSEDKSEWQVKAEEYLNDLKRVQADFENYKKRQAESQKELGGYLIEKLVLDIVPVLDNFRAATMHVPEEQKSSPWVVGIQYIEKQLEDVIKQNGVEVIEVKVGDQFDPTIHEAVSHEQEGKENSEEKVAKVLQNGFRIGSKVIRPAKVSVK